MARCERCARVPNRNLLDSATVHVRDPTNGTHAQWILERIDANRVALRVRDIGTYLARCNGCIVDGAYPDSAFVHASDWRHATWAQWTVEPLANGKVAFKSDTGHYLARCNNCAGGAPADRAFVHSTSSADPWAQWEVGCINGFVTAPPAATEMPSVRPREDHTKKHKHNKEEKRQRREDAAPYNNDESENSRPTRAGRSGIDVYVLDDGRGEGATNYNALDHGSDRRHYCSGLHWIVILPFFCVGVFVTVQRVITFLRQRHAARHSASALSITAIPMATEEEYVPLRSAEST